MQANWISVLSTAALAACAVMSVAAPAHAAPGGYQTAVQDDSPYVYYRFGESPITDGLTTADLSTNARTGEYNGTPTGGVAGVGTGSDTAATFSSAATGINTQYVRSSLNSFGGSMGASSYEFVFKWTTSAAKTRQSLFGVFSQGNLTTNSNGVSTVDVTLNSFGNDALGDKPDATRLYIKGTDDDQAGAHFVNAALYDGNYHHVVFTYDNTQAGVGAFKAYVDGIPQTLVLDNLTPNPADADNDPDGFSNFNVPAVFAARNVRNTTAVDGAGVQRVANVTLDEAALYTTVLSPEDVALHATAAGFTVPEPGALTLAGVVGLGLLGRRRRRA